MVSTIYTDVETNTLCISMMSLKLFYIFIKRPTKISYLQLPEINNREFISRDFDELAGAFARNSAKGPDREKILERARKKMSKLKKDEDRKNAAKDRPKSE